MRASSQTVVLICVLMMGSGALLGVERDHQIEAEDYFSLVSVMQCALSPDGSHVAYTEMGWGGPDERRTTELWVVDTATTTRQRLTFDRVGAGSPRWSADGRFIYFTAGFERPGASKAPWDGSTQVWRVSPGGGEPFPVTRVADGIELYDLGSGDTLYYTTTEKVVADEWEGLQEEFSELEYGAGVTHPSQLWTLDLESWRAARVIDDGRYIRDLAVAPDGRRIAMITDPEQALVTHEGWSRLDVYDTASKEIAHLTGPRWRQDHPSPFGWLGNLAWADDGDAVAFTISFDGYPTEINVAEWTGGTASLRTLERPRSVTVDATRPQWRAGARDLCYLGEERARVRLLCAEGVSGETQGRTRTLTPGDVVVDGFSLAASGEAAAVILATTDHPQDLFMVSPRGEYRRITTVNPQMDTWMLPQISVVSWKGAGGDAVEGILELPPGYQPADGPLPLVVELHGGPTSATRLQLRFWIYGRTLLPAKGYALLSPNYRGSTGYGDRFLTDLIGRENDIEVEDILEGVEAMVERGIADPERLGVMGWSNGGYLTNSLITKSGRFKAASSGAGVLDMVIQWGTEDTPGHVVNFVGGLPWEVPEAYRKASSLYDLDRVTTATLIHVGGSDPRVPPAHSRALFRALHRYLGVPTQLVVYPGESHGLSVRSHRLAKMKWDLAWFERYLLGTEQEED